MRTLTQGCPASIHHGGGRAELSALACALNISAKLVHLGLSTFGGEAGLLSALRRHKRVAEKSWDATGGALVPRRLVFHFDGSDKAEWMSIAARKHSASRAYQLDRLQRASVMLDLGGNVGLASIAAYYRNRSVRVLALEPQPRTFFFFMWNLHANRVPILSAKGFRSHAAGVRALNLAYTRDGRTAMIAAHPSGASMIASEIRSDEARLLNGRAAGARDSVPPVPVRSSNMTTLLRRHGLLTAGSIALLKVDCEGCEKDLSLELADGKLSSCFQRVAGEMHGCSLERDSRRNLCADGTQRRLVRAGLNPDENTFTRAP